MTLKRYNFLFTVALTLVVAGSIGSAAFAQERTQEAANVEATSESVEAASYNNTRSNRSTVVASDINVCDGVTCADGSCAATTDECVAEDLAADSVCNGFLCNDGQCVTSEAMCGITADMTEDMAADSVCNGFLCNDGQCVSSEAMCGIAAEGAAAVRVGDDCDDTDERCTPGAAELADVVCDTADDDCDGDSLDDGQRAQDYNSSRSNKPRTAANPVDSLDDDDDGDGLPTAVNARASAEVQLFGAHLNADGSVDTKALKKGDRLSASASANSSDEEPEFARLSDIKGEVRVNQETGKRELSSVAVAAQDLRDWNTDDREAFRRLQVAVASNTPEQASLRITQQVLNNEKIEKLEVTQTEAQVTYRAEMRLFGLIPVEREVEGRAQANGTVEIDYPWYRFLSTTPDRAEIENQLQTSIEILMTMTADPI